MKNFLFILLFVGNLSSNFFGQSPAGINYQAIIRDAGNIILSNQSIAFRFSIYQDSVGGINVYDELFLTTTNSFGLVNITIGYGTSNDNFSDINWANGPYFLETAMNDLGAGTWVIIGTSQLLSVPYAFHANTTDSIAGGISGMEEDPHFSSLASGITISDIALWNSYIDTDTQLDSTDIVNLGFVAGPHTIDTDTQLDSTDIANLGFVAGPHPIDTDTQLDSTDIANLGFVAGPHTIDTDTQLDSTDVANFGYVAEKTYSIGLYPELGGYVFRISADGKHGLVAEIQDQSTALVKWYGCDNYINNPNNHSLNGQKFCDWRLPSKNELNEMYNHRIAIGGNFNLSYWSSTQSANATAWAQYFNSAGSQSNSSKISPAHYVRGIREF